MTNAAQIGGQKLVLKSAHARITTFPVPHVSWTQDEFETAVVHLVNRLVKLGWPLVRPLLHDRDVQVYRRHLMQLVWPAFGRQSAMTHADRVSLWALLHQVRRRLAT